MKNNQDLRKFLRQKTNEIIVMKYMFIESLEDNFGEEYIYRLYKISPDTIRKLYFSLPENEREEMRTKINEQIKSGEIDLKNKAVEWHKEGLKSEAASRQSRENWRKIRGEH